MHFVYILESEKDSQHWYVGVTDNVERRLHEHNEGNSAHSNKYKPWRIKNYIAFEGRQKAELFERYIKSHSGRAFTKKHF